MSVLSCGVDGLESEANNEMLYYRIALSHNKLSSFPARFSECTSLRYLNVRNNRISEFPLPVMLTLSSVLAYSKVPHD